MSPEATVETISLGTPTGRSRIACAAIDELPEPPTAAAPSRRPSACSRASTAAAPRPMASTAAPRSAGAHELGVVGAARARDLLARARRPRSAARPARPRRPAATSTPASRRRSRRKPYSMPLVSSVPTRTTVAISRAPRRGSGAAARGRPTSSAAVVSAKIRPATITSWRSAIAVAMARFCSTTRIARPSAASAAEGLDQGLDDRRREPLGGLVHDQQLAGWPAARGRWRASAARRRRAACRRSGGARPGAGRARRRRRASSGGCRAAARPSAGARRR